MSLDPNRLILTGENPFIRLSDTDGGATTHQCEFLAHPDLACSAQDMCFT